MAPTSVLEWKLQCAAMEDSSVPPIDPDFEPQSRPRSCTWPLPRPDISVVKPDGVADGTESAAGTPPADEDIKPEPQQITSEPDKASAAAAGAEGGVAAGGGVGGAGATPRKGSSRRNAWGNQSYADLISQAIENSPEKRLTLAQIYEWMVKTVPYFRDKGDSNSSAGWKVRRGRCWCYLLHWREGGLSYTFQSTNQSLFIQGIPGVLIRIKI